MLRIVRIATYATLWILASVYAILRGGEPERVGAVCLLWLSTGFLIVRQFTTFNDSGIDVGSMIVDSVGLVALLTLALKANRTWPIWACSAQVIAITAHIVRYMAVHEVYLAYAIMFRAPGYLQCIVLLVGAYSHHQRVLKGVNYSSWRT